MVQLAGHKIAKEWVEAHPVTSLSAPSGPGRRLLPAPPRLTRAGLLTLVLWSKAWHHGGATFVETASNSDSQRHAGAPKRSEPDEPSGVSYE